MALLYRKAMSSTLMRAQTVFRPTGIIASYNNRPAFRTQVTDLRNYSGNFSSPEKTGIENLYYALQTQHEFLESDHRSLKDKHESLKKHFETFREQFDGQRKDIKEKAAVDATSTSTSSAGEVAFKYFVYFIVYIVALQTAWEVYAWNRRQVTVSSTYKPVVQDSDGKWKPQKVQ